MGIIYDECDNFHTQTLLFNFKFRRLSRPVGPVGRLTTSRSPPPPPLAMGAPGCQASCGGGTAPCKGVLGEASRLQARMRDSAHVGGLKAGSRTPLRDASNLSSSSISTASRDLQGFEQSSGVADEQQVCSSTSTYAHSPDGILPDDLQPQLPPLMFLRSDNNILLCPRIRAMWTHPMSKTAGPKL